MFHTQTVLFIDHRQPQAMKADALFNERMRADYQIDPAHGNSLKDFFSLSGCRPSTQKGRSDGKFMEEPGEIKRVLLGQNLCGSHEGRLPADFYAHEHCRTRHHRLSPAHISLQHALQWIG